MDLTSENDSYISLKLGDKKIVDKKTIENENNPKIFHCFEFEHTLPGPSELLIQFYDEDTLKLDELIGETKIDVERRFFDRTFREHKN